MSISTRSHVRSGQEGRSEMRVQLSASNITHRLENVAFSRLEILILWTRNSLI